MSYKREQIESAVKSKGHVWFEDANNKGFDVMRSEDGFNFTKVGYINGHNNSTETNHYTFDDKSVVASKMYYYKLRQIDNDGKTSETKIVNAMITGGSSLYGSGAV